MKFSKQCVSGRDIDLREFNLGVVKQLTVDKFMEDYDLLDFVKPFYLEQTWALNEEFRESNIPFTYFIFLSSQQEGVLVELIRSLKLLYDTEDVNLVKYGESDYKLIIKSNDKAIAFVDDSNFDVLSEVMLEICKFDKPSPEPVLKGDAELVEKMKKARAKYDKEHKNKNTITFEGIVREVIHHRRIVYDDIKNWTVWQLKDVYIVESMRNQEDRQWMLASSGNYKIEKIDRWQDKTKIVHE